MKTITDDDDELDLNEEEKQLLDRANGRVLIFYLSGPTIFGVAKANSREHNAIENIDALILDLSDVPMLGVTASLALENAIVEAIDKGRHVFIVGATGSIKRRLEKFGILKRIPPHHLTIDRTEALRQAVSLVENNPFHTANMSEGSTASV